MPDWDKQSDDDRSSTIEEVQRLCRRRLDELGAQMKELEEVAHRAAAQLNVVMSERRRIESVLEATKETEPQRYEESAAVNTLVTGGTLR